MMRRCDDRANLDRLIRVTVWVLGLAYCGLVWAFVVLLLEGFL